MSLSKRTDFPVFKQDAELVYLDSAATTHKPQCVIDAVASQLAYENGSPHRGAHRASVNATRIYDSAKQTVAAFIGAASEKEIIFTKNATEALNLVAHSYGLSHVKRGQNIVLAITAHHSNLVPWQRVAKHVGAELRYLYIDQTGAFTVESLNAIDEQTALISCPIISNAYGMLHDVKDLVLRARSVGAVIVLDAAQAVGHSPIDVLELDCDFLAFSGHKLYAPQGIGVLYGKAELLETMTPYMSGGDMIEYVMEQETTYAGIPDRFEAGTQNVSGAAGLKAAIDYIEQIGLETIEAHEKALVSYGLKRLSALDFVKIIGPLDPRQRGALITFKVEGVHPHDVASLLDVKGIAIRAGHHCCQPLMQYLGEPATCRVSFSIYNDLSDVDALIDGLIYVREVFGYGH